MEVWRPFKNTKKQPLNRFEHLLKVREIPAKPLLKLDVFF